MPYLALTFISVVVFALVHLLAEKVRKLEIISQGRFLSIGGGVAIAYVFIDLLPKLSKGELVVREALAGIFPYFERHVFVMALAGFLLFFIIDRTSSVLQERKTFWLSISSYALFNFLIGYAVVDKNNPEVQPLALFTISIALHYFVNDYTLSENYGNRYGKTGKWILILSLFLGWTVGLMMELPQAAIALVSAFIGGGVIMNVTRHELPEENPHSLGAFLLSTVIYTIILLFTHS